MRLAITTDGQELADPVANRFGRARAFLVVDTATEACELIDNVQNLQAAQGAGIQAAQHLADADVAAVLTGHVGPKAFAVLAAAGIAVVTGATGSCAEALAAYRAGRLHPSDDADVAAHW